MRERVLNDRAELEEVKLSGEEFELIRRLAREKFGLELRQGKQELVAARLGRILRHRGLDSFQSYCLYVQADRSGEALAEMIDALTTNYTSFMREKSHFDFLARVLLPAWKNRRQIRIWSAGCASGEEAYSVAFTLLDAGRPAGSPEWFILATDISTRALAEARRAVYPKERVAELPHGWLKKYFLKGYGSSKGLYKVRPEVRELIEFRRLNLIEPYSHPAPFALILCRNVMIYFDAATRERVVKQLAAWIEPGGYLFVGHSESLAGLKSGLEYVAPAIYRKPPAQMAAKARGRSDK